MSQATIGRSPVHENSGSGVQDQSVAELVKSLSQETSRLVRDEIKLATLELKEKGKHAGVGIGMFGAAGVVALFGAGALMASVIMVLALAMDAWAAALIVAGTLFAVATILALTGKRQVAQAVPPAPEEAMDSIKSDIVVLKESVHR
jgi:uncharacterized membrane protein YqjE